MKLRTLGAGGYKEFDEGLVKYKDENGEWTWDFTLLYTKPQHMIWEIKRKVYRRLPHSNFSTIKKYVEECKNKGETASLNEYLKTHPTSAQWYYYQEDSNGNLKLISTSIPDNTYVHELRNAVIEGLIKLADKDYLKNFNNTPITGNTKDTKAIYDVSNNEKFKYIRSKDYINKYQEKNIDYIDANEYTFVGPYSFNCPGTSEINSISINYNDNKTVELSANNPTSKDFKIIFELSESSQEDFEITYDKNGMPNIKPINVAYYQEFNKYENIDNKDFNENGTFKTYDEKENKFNKKFYLLVNKNSSAYKINNIRIGLKYQTIEITEVELQKTEITQRPICNDVKFDTQGSNIPFDRVINLIPPVNLTLDKVNSLDLEGDELYNIPNIPFNIKFEQDGKQIYNKDVTTGKDGKVKIEKVIPNSRNDITVTITEKKDIDGDGYKVLSEPLVITLQCSDDGTYWKEKNGAGKLSGGEKYVVNYNINATIGLTVKLENKSIIEKLTLLKTSSVGGGKVEKAKFKLTLTNVASIKNHQIPEAGEVTIIETTNSDGNLVLEDIEIKNLNEPVVITIEEIEAPVGYKKIEGTITVTLKRKGNTYTIHKAEKEDTVTDDEFEAGEVTLKNHELELDIQDIPVMNLGGIVWTEKIKTGKKQPDINNTYSESDDEALGGVEVRLLDGNNNVIATTTTAKQDGEKVTYLNNLGKEVTVELKQGQYLFTKLNKLNNGTNYIPVGTDYKVEIDYDGITYNPLINPDASMLYKNKEDNKGVFSKITSEDDHGLADGTKTISGTENEKQSKTNDGYTINYTLQDEDEENIPDKAIYSNVEKDGKQAFVTARSEKYLQKTDDWKTTWKDNNGVGEINLENYAFDINFGLYKKFFDLNLGTNVDSAEVKINGQTSTYTYDQILDGMLNDDLEKMYRTTDGEVDYNLYLAYSDYNYRIDDYKVPGTDSDSLGEPYGENLPSDSKDKSTELQVSVTYKLRINNQSTQHNAIVNKVKYSYDEGYEYVESDGNVTDNNDKKELLIENIVVGPGESKEITLKFKVKKNEDGTFFKAPSDTSKYTNVAEIVEYSTTEGRLVDADSAPGNTFLGENNPTDRREDDTDTANGIVIRFKENAERSISGKVFDASNNNGVSDVIVQLIELVEINNQQYEYIWQETVAAPKDKEGKPTVTTTVKTTATSGGRGETYTVENVGQGEYKFTERIIPGNYIVRFIYGDGRTYDITENTLKYNGEDYKSTYVDYNYNAEWYNNISLNGENSKAVDNEARRLRVMSYAVDVDGNKGKKLDLLDANIGGLSEEEKKTLTEEVIPSTWMCAETLKIKMPVDTDDQKDVRDELTVSNGNAPRTENTQFNNVNFGLMERPKTKLVLEKHITGLTVKPVASGVNLIANATADINKILDQGEGDQIQLEGQQDGLVAQKSGRNDRGQWYLQTDTTELAQGADAYITYTYVIKNEGDEDYLSETLVNEYKNDKEGTYQQYLENQESLVKEKIKSKGFTKGEYLSGSYYRKNDNAFTPTLVQASVEQIQEALNPKVKFVNSTTDFSKTDRDPSIRYAYYDVEGNKEENNANIKEIITITQGTKTKKLLQTGETLGTTTSDKNKFINDTMDTSKKLVVSVGLSASEIENGGVYDSYIAQVTHYTNAAGRRDQSTPDNLSYVHSEDKTKILATDNEEDEFWAERFTITKPTGEDKITPVQIAIITISAVAVLGVGIILIKKFVLKK